MYYVYLLKSLKDGKNYIGFTNNLRERFKEHNAGNVFSTKYRYPFVLEYYEAYKHRSSALEREKKLKQFGQAMRRLNERIKQSPNYSDGR